MRESSALDVIELLRRKGADVRYHDPYVPEFAHNGHGLRSEPDLAQALANAAVVARCSIVDANDGERVTRHAAAHQ